MATTLAPAPVSTRQVTWDPTSRTFVGEMSSTHGFGRVYADSADEGLTLVSHRTGRELVFVVTDEHRDADGDVTHWSLITTSPTDVYRMTIFND